MLPRTHFISCMILSALLYPLFGLDIVFIFIGGWLIDVDHYFIYFYKTKNFNLIKGVRYYTKKEYLKGKNNFNPKKIPLFVFHNIELLILSFILSFYIREFFFISIGLVTHYIMDHIHEITYHKKIIKPVSAIKFLFTFKFN